MKKKLFVVLVCLVLFVVFNLPYAVAEEARPPHIGCGYGDPVDYGEGKHNGLDYDIPIGTPIIACTAGTVDWIGQSVIKGPYGGGEFVQLKHTENFYSIYGHLSKLFVSKGQSVKRGQLIGLSGASGNGYAHLHFAVSSRPDVMGLYSRALNPHKYWIDDVQQCYDPERKYSWLSSNKITVPVACGEYEKFLKNKLNK